MSAVARKGSGPGDAARPIDRLRSMARQRPILQAPLHAALSRHASGAAADLDSWAEAIVHLAFVNAGASVLMAMLRISAVTPPGPQALPRLAAAAMFAAAICRKAGSAATRAALQARSDLAPRLDPLSQGEESAWWRALARLADDAPDCVAVLAGSSGRVLAGCGALHMEDVVAAGLRSSADKAQRHAFFALDSPEARRVLDHLAGAVTFSRVQGQLRGFVTALWGVSYPLKELPSAQEDKPPRTALSSGIVLLPDVFRGVPRGSATALYRASAAHATAHLAFGGPPFDPARLKPVQIVLVGLIEDARVETLAMRRFPGLAKLWGPYHVAEASHLKTAPSILARLARALFDPTFEDQDGIVSKSRALFRAEPDLADPGLSRRIGGLLGNDIGQMRIQFNARLHIVEPPYRDDNLGLWTLPPPPPDAMLQDIEVAVSSVRIERAPDKDDADQSQQADAPPGESPGRARPVAPDDRGVAVARYPEWDCAAAREQPDWVTIRDVETAHGPASDIDDALARDAGLRRRVERLVRKARIGRPTRLRRQPDGLDLDIDAAIEVMIALRTGEIPEDRIHTRKVLRSRDLAVLVLIDTSASTRERVPTANASILAVETLAVAVLAQAMEKLGDRFALRAFASNGRNEVRIARLKDFEGRFEGAAKARLAGLQPGYSTRLGAALRHAGAELAPLAATRRIVIALTDGAPSDIDVAEPAELVEDARRAVLGLHGRGCDVFGITLDPMGQGAGAAVFGRRNHMPVRRIEELPSRLSELYFRIVRR